MSSTEPSSAALKVADLAVRVSRRVWKALPERLRKDLEDRVFYVIFQKTRVENDAYGWRPEPGKTAGTGDGEGAPGAPPEPGGLTQRHRDTPGG